MNNILKAFTTVTIISIITRCLSFVFKIYLTRQLGPEILGLYQITISIIMFLVCFSSSGIPVTLSRITAETNATNDLKKERSVLTTSLLLSLFLCILPISMLLVFPNILNGIFQDTRCIKLFFIMLPMVITTSIYSIIRGWFWGKKQFNIFSLTEFFDEIIKVIIAIILFSGILFSIDKFYTYAISMLIGDILTIIMLLIIFFIKGGKFEKPKHLVEITKSSAPLTTSRLLSAILSSFLSITLPLMLVKNGLSSSEATAEFGRASGMVMPLIFAPGSILGSLGVVLIPEVATLAAKKDNNALSLKFNKSLFFAFIITSLFNLVYIALGKDITVMLYNDFKSGNYLFIASFLMLPMGLNGLLTSMLNSLKKENKTFISYIISSIVLILIIYLTPKYIGIYSYFLGLILFHSMSTILNYIFIRKIIKINYKKVILGLIIYTLSIVFGLIFNKISKIYNFSATLNVFIYGLVMIALLIPPIIYFYRKKIVKF